MSEVEITGVTQEEGIRYAFLVGQTIIGMVILTASSGPHPWLWLSIRRQSVVSGGAETKEAVAEMVQRAYFPSLVQMPE